MSLRARLFIKFHQVATGTLRVSAEVADEFASHIANAHEGIHVVSQLCTGANALQSNTLAPMLERWFRLVPEYDMPARLLAQKPGQPSNVTAISEAGALMLRKAGFPRSHVARDIELTMADLMVRLDRDSVHAGDDCESHATSMRAANESSIGSLLEQIRKAGFLPSISGGEATWIVKSSADPGRPIGVIAQQWQEAELLVASETSLRELFGLSEPSLHFAYWCQASPSLVLAALREGKALPSRC
jgi:hypothetical protein